MGKLFKEVKAASYEAKMIFGDVVYDASRICGDHIGAWGRHEKLRRRVACGFIGFLLKIGYLHW